MIDWSLDTSTSNSHYLCQGGKKSKTLLHTLLPSKTFTSDARNWQPSPPPLPTLEITHTPTLGPFSVLIYLVHRFNLKYVLECRKSDHSTNWTRSFSWLRACSVTPNMANVLCPSCRCNNGNLNNLSQREVRINLGTGNRGLSYVYHSYCITVYGVDEKGLTDRHVRTLNVPRPCGAAN